MALIHHNNKIVPEEPHSTASDMFELQLAGHKGHGLFARQDIPRGTRIFAEAPVISLPPNQKKINLLKHFEKLTPAQHVQYTELSYNERLVQPPLRQAIRQHLASNSQYSGQALDAAAEDMIKMHAIFFTNAVTMGADGCHGEGIFLQFSRINHSCTPNVQNSYNATIRKETVHAVRDIKAGEELLSCYVPPLRTREQRQEALEQWSFECHCDACDGAEAKVHERRRRELFQLDQAFAIYESGNILRAATSPFQVPTNHRQALAAAEEMVTLLKEEGLFGIDLAHAYRECSKYSVKEGQMAKAMAYARKELEIEFACVGEDTEHLGEQGARFWINSLETMSEAEKVKARMNEKRNAKEQKKSDKKAAKKAGKGRR